MANTNVINTNQSINSNVNNTTVTEPFQSNNNNGYINVSPEVIVPVEVNTQQVENVNVNLNLPVFGPKTKVESAFLGEYDKLIFPSIYKKGIEDWGKLSLAITKHLQENFKDENTSQKTIRKLVNEVYEICKKQLKKGMTCKFVKARTKARDKLIAEVDKTKIHQNYNGNNQELVNHFNLLNTKKDTQNENKKEIIIEENDEQEINLDSDDEEINEDGLNSNNETQPLLSHLKHKKNKDSKSNRIIVKKTLYEKFIRKTARCKKNPFTLDEFKEVLDKRRNHNPGYDGICYELIRKCEALQKKLVSLYNDIFKSGKIPEYWNYGIVYSLYKGSGVTTDPKNYRSIIMSDTLSKLFWHLINFRIKTYINKNKIIDIRYQKAYSENVRGTEENLFIHQQVKPKSDFVIYLDIKNAYGSIYPELVRKVLKYHNFSKTYISIISNYIENRYILFKNKNEKQFHNWNCGLSQGLGISNYIFILCMDYIIKRTLRRFPSDTNGVKVGEDHYFIQAFADDIVIYGCYEKKDTIQKMLNYMNKKFTNFNLNVQVKKSYIDYVNTSYKPKFNIGNNMLCDIPADYKYLGQYVNIDKAWENFTKEVKVSLNEIKGLFQQKLVSANEKDFWYAYHTMWNNKINWFLRVNNITDKNIKMIEKIEKEWLSGITGLEDKMKDSDFEERKENALMCRFTALSKSLDKRVVNLYKSSIGDNSYTEIKKMTETKGKNLNTGFKMSSIYSTV